MPPDVQSSVETPEALLQLLDLQIAAQRARRREVSPHRGVTLAAGILLIVGGALAAIVFLFVSVTDSAHRKTPARPSIDHHP